jgi:hypothetical protein
MIILAYIDYGFIVMFFLIVGSFVFVISRPRDKRVLAGEKLPKMRQEKIAYTVLAGLFLFFLLVTWMTSKQARS